jgi:hypothetical protein
LKQHFLQYKVHVGIVWHYFPGNFSQKMRIKILDKNSVKNEYIDSDTVFTFFP